MLFRLWAFVASLPLGVLATFAWPRELDALATVVASAVAGACGVALASLAARLGDDTPDRAAHVARGASAGLVALPATAAAALRLGPPAWVWLALSCVVLGLALWRASRAAKAVPGVAGSIAAGALAPALAALVGVFVGVGYGWLGPSSPEPDATLRAGVFDLDSRVPLREPKVCGSRLAAVTTLVQNGSAPRFDADGETVWYEARTADGRSQVHRLSPAGEVVCWTCAEAGNNRRPAPHPTGSGLLFDSDRFASWQRPADTEVMLGTRRGLGGPRHPARRLTFSPGPDDHAFYDPSGGGLLWSHGGAGRFEVQRAAILGGHGGLLLSDPITLFRGRAAWTVPLGWSPDGRTLVAGFGQPLAPLTGVQLDPGSAERRRLEGGVLAGSVSFSADGRVMAVASSTAEGALRLAPSALGNVLARWHQRPEPRARGTRIELGDPSGPLQQLELGELASWGAPTGIALLRDASGFVLAQRGPLGERMVRAALECTGPAPAILGLRAPHR